MKIVFKSEDYSELNFERTYSEGFSVDEKSGITELTTAFDFKGIKNKVHRIYCPGFICSLIDESLENELVQILRGDFPYIQMHFELSSTACFYYPSEKFSPVTDIPLGTHSLLYYPALNGSLHYMKKPRSFSVQIELSLGFLRKIFNDDLGVLGEFGEKIERSLPAILGNGSFPITAAMKNILFEIRDCAYSGSLKKIFTEAKVIELLALQISQVTSRAKPTQLKHADIDKLHEIRDLLLLNLNQPLSIEELAKLAGINRTKLQDGFKELFGTTIFGYISGQRLENAKKLILDGNNIPISEVAVSSGYKNPQHFTAAFKRKFGYLPRDIKR